MIILGFIWTIYKVPRYLHTNPMIRAPTTLPGHPEYKSWSCCHTSVSDCDCVRWLFWVNVRKYTLRRKWRRWWWKWKWLNLFVQRDIPQLLSCNQHLFITMIIFDPIKNPQFRRKYLKKWHFFECMLKIDCDRLKKEMNWCVLLLLLHWILQWQVHEVL